jgi:hypothetical protein
MDEEDAIAIAIIHNFTGNDGLVNTVGQETRFF